MNTANPAPKTGEMIIATDNPIAAPAITPKVLEALPDVIWLTRECRKRKIPNNPCSIPKRNSAISAARNTATTAYAGNIMADNDKPIAKVPMQTSVALIQRGDFKQTARGVLTSPCRALWT